MVKLKRLPPHGPFVKFTTADGSHEIRRKGEKKAARWTVWHRVGGVPLVIAGPFTTLAMAKSALGVAVKVKRRRG